MVAMVFPGVRLRTYLSLGLHNVLRVAAHRFAKKAALYRFLRQSGELPIAPFFRSRPSPPTANAVARRDWIVTGTWFGAHKFSFETAPDWQANPFTGARVDSLAPWYRLPDFDPAVGDIKAVWEASRFDWLLAMAQRAALGDAAELGRLNLWLEDWTRANPPYVGANWKCGQEAAIRVMHLALAGMLLDQLQRPSPQLLHLVRIHLARIRATFHYAVAQQNNHATSEAAALFIGGSMLQLSGDPFGTRAARLGRAQLEKLALSLVAPDGSFSQYSLVYHRLMLDTYCLAESWRRSRQLEPFAAPVLERLAAATRWLFQLVDPITGDGPNLGANDGTRLMGFTDQSHRDFRPTLQWAAVLFLNARALPADGPWNQPIHWLGQELPERALANPSSVTLLNGGLHVLREDKAVAYLRFPAFRFRPSQADCLHVDLWVSGENILRDAGTFSYASDDLDYFTSAEAHNTIQFDGRDQMPRVSRFLYGSWLTPTSIEAVRERKDGVEAGAAYRDRWGSEHRRRVRLEQRRLQCEDCISGKARVGVLRWRLKPGKWRIDGGVVTDGRVKLAVEIDGKTASPRLVEGSESRFYLHRRPLQVVEISLPVPATVRTTIAFS
jgi:hypothetical protein